MQHRIGLYPGTFDPIHSGHITFALEVLRRCKLDEVVFLPEQSPWRKQGVTPIHHRTALIEKAIQATAGLRVLQLGTEQFTIQHTLPALQTMFAPAHITLLIGSDIAQGLHHWEGVELLVREVSFAVGLRAGDTPGGVAAAMPPLANYTIMQTPDAHVASSQIRKGAASNLSPAARKYMQAHKLY